MKYKCIVVTALWASSSVLNPSSPLRNTPHPNSDCETLNHSKPISWRQSWYQSSDCPTGFQLQTRHVTAPALSFKFKTDLSEAGVKNIVVIQRYRFQITSFILSKPIYVNQWRCKVNKLICNNNLWFQHNMSFNNLVTTVVTTTPSIQIWTSPLHHHPNWGKRF